VQASAFVWMFPLVFASSAFVPVSTVPGWPQAFVKVNPISIVVDALRALLLGGPTATHVLQALAWIAAITVAYFTLTVQQYRRLA
jgi:ABC-type polysaccharide/polyol phosphate export permease